MAESDLHERIRRIQLVERFPKHEPREDDPHYAGFNLARKRMKEAGLLRCAVCGSEERIELHHKYVEYAIQNAVDICRLDALLGLDLDAEAFAIWVESPGNLEPLCFEHHRGLLGVHNLPEPDWSAIRIQKHGIEPLASITRR